MEKSPAGRQGSYDWITNLRQASARELKVLQQSMVQRERKACTLWIWRNGRIRGICSFYVGNGIEMEIVSNCVVYDRKASPLGLAFLYLMGRYVARCQRLLRHLL